MSRLVASLAIASALAFAPAVGLSFADPRPPAEPAKVSVEVSPNPVSPGGTARAVVRLAPQSGIKINMYPQIRLEVKGQEALVADGKATLGNTRPPAADADPEANYFTTIDPLELELLLADGAPAGEHEIEGKLTYFYCVKASGFCAPKRTSIRIPIAVR